MIRVEKIYIALLLSLAIVRADVVYSTNGRSIEGIIREQTPEHVILDLGAGSMTIRRSQILRVEMGSIDENAALFNGWRQRYFLNDRYLPEGQKSLADAFKKLKAARSASIKARRSIVDLSRSEDKLTQKIEALERSRLVASQALAGAEPVGDVAAYNALVARVNALQADISLSRMELHKSGERRSVLLETLAAYLETIAAFRNLYDERLQVYRQGPPDTGHAFFFEQIAKDLAAYEHEFKGTEVATVRRGSSSIVHALVNGKQSGTFIVDTGATLMTVTERFAAALGIKTAQLPRVTVAMADGREVDARSVTLRSVRLGDAQVEDVRAVVLPEQPADGIDGLLGMAFLRNFSVHLDGATGKLQLKRFAPDE